MRSRPSQRRLGAFDWRGPPELSEPAGISDHERLLITAIALRRLETAHVEMDLNRLGEHQLEASQ